VKAPSRFFAPLHALCAFTVLFIGPWHLAIPRFLDLPAPPNYGFAPVCSVDFSPFLTT
jgi:hypothetical protein